MPVSIRQTRKGHYRVSTPHGVHAKDTTKTNAERQARLLRGVEHGWHPTGRHARESVITAQAQVLVKEVLTERRAKK